MSADDDDPFIAQTLALLRAESARTQDERLDATLRAAPRPPAARRIRARRPLLGYTLTALAAAIIAAVITYGLTRLAAPVGATSDDAFALDGDAPTSVSLPAITLDPQGRPSEIARRVAGRLEGERVLFRAGQIMRIEHYREGQLDGPTLDFDGLGRLVALTTWSAGRERGSYLELAPDGTVRASGQR